MRTDRMRQIGDGAVEVLAESGPRGLTHRAVDRHLGLPSGSTSYYCKTRQSLVNLTAETILKQDWEDFERFTSGARTDLEGVLNHLGSVECRARMLARFELYIEGARDREFRLQLAKNRRAFVIFVTRALSGDSEATEPSTEAHRIVVEFESGLFQKLLAHD